MLSDNIFLTSWRVFIKSSRDLLDKSRKRDRSKSPKRGVKALITDKSCDFVNELSSFWLSASSRVTGIGCQIPSDVLLISRALMKSILFVCAISLNLFPFMLIFLFVMSKSFNKLHND